MGIDRRNFLKKGSMLMAGTMLAPSFLQNYSGANAEVPHELKTAYGLSHFGVTQEDLQKVLTAALEKGGDYADLFFEHSFSNSVVLRDGTVNQAGSNIDFGMGVRVLAGDQTGYAYVEEVTLEEMLRAARTAARIATGTAKDRVIGLTEKKLSNDFYRVKKAWDKVVIADKKPFIQKLNDRIFSLDDRVIKASVVFNDQTSHVLFANTEGQFYYDYRSMVSLVAVCIMSEDGKIENSFASRSFRMGGEFMTDAVIEELAKEAVDKTSLLFKAIKPKGGEMPVVMAAGGSGILLHEAIGHAFEADFNRKNTSIFSDKLNKQICDKHINVLDDGTIPFNRGSVNVDDEGVDGQKTYIVREGVLTSYLHDRISAKHYGVQPTGNGRRESFRMMPIPRMRATYMENGNYSEEDIIASVKNGIYARTFTNGQVQIGAGDFTFFVKDGYLIENGKLTQPVKDVNIIGNGPQALADITMVGNNYVMDNGTWTCGKDGQNCPVTCGLPSVLVSKLTVGGES